MVYWHPVLIGKNTYKYETCTNALVYKITSIIIIVNDQQASLKVC